LYDSDENTHLSFTQGAGHGGSHPHLAHEFAMALVEGRDPFPNAKQSAKLDLHRHPSASERALEGGAIKHLPKETLRYDGPLLGIRARDRPDHGLFLRARKKFQIL